MNKNYTYEILDIKQYYRKKHDERFKITTPVDIYEFIKEDVAHCTREKLIILGLDSSNSVLFSYVSSIGTVNSAMVHPRNIFQPLLLNNATSFIMIHQHPSGNLKASDEDMNVTHRMLEASNIIGIQLLDHVIVTDEGYFSFREGDLFG
ncbi:JAB domain-containing protein [Staphylococcus aureus]|uniref:JAB domain-containing protein n=1 Tax=Staphylococcus aureus TaxID=1280 RepID=UPI002891D71D|nr:JAB domain-containing protein [Staphylococcus aureus]MDT3072999.1 JAB domain-containing protein [Staphylococcus aureus]MDT3271573.1 JAB domain-containing protein [Staphylococcus aureus]HEA0073462.1 JAB domain-containing protein [Staphylococcus aureus]HEA0083203.1 JAB domain-containing protein [Staphylococcus aureus]